MMNARINTARQTQKNSDVTSAAGSLLQRKLTIGASNDPLEQEADRVADQVMAATTDPATNSAPRRIQRFTGHSSGENSAAPASVDSVLASGGSPLEPALQQDMSQHFGHDFSRVRVHADAAAEQSARDVNAHAYTVGHDIAFGAGQFAPGTHEGRRLIAHELTHVVQQAAEPRIGTVEDARGRESGRAALRIGHGSASSIATGISRSLQRQPEGERAEDKPLIPIPVFDQLDPAITVPDIEGIPEFLRGQEMKLSDLQKALDALPGRSKPKGLAGFCERFNMEEAKGLCCPKFVREPDKCCSHRRMDLFQGRCCTSEEVQVQGRCIKPKRAPVVVPLPKSEPAPDPAPTPAPKAAVPVSTTIFFNFDQPESGNTGKKSLHASATSDGATNFDQLVQHLKDNLSFKAQLTGKASSEGTAAYNRELGERRARLVAEELATRGVDRSRITDPPNAASGCAAVEDGIRNCGESGGSTKANVSDRQVHAQVFKP